MNNAYIPNTSAIPNILFDQWMSVLTPAEFKIIMCISRKTYGWHKDFDCISIKQIEKMTGLHRSGIIKSLEKLMEIGLIIKIKSKTSDGDDAPNRYTVNVHCVVGGSLQNRPPVVDSVDPGVVYSVDPQKKTNTKERHTKETPPTSSNSEPPKQPASQGSAGADGMGVDSSSKPKKEKAPTAFSAEVKEITSKMIAIARKCSPVYREPDKLDKFHEQVALMLEKDEQDAKLLLKTFEWACSDSVQRGDFKGWQSVVCANRRKGKVSNPAEIFRAHYSTIHSQMTSQPVRKFAPSSNNQRAFDALKEAKKDAI